MDYKIRISLEKNVNLAVTEKRNLILGRSVRSYPNLQNCIMLYILQSYNLRYMKRGKNIKL